MSGINERHWTMDEITLLERLIACRSLTPDAAGSLDIAEAALSGAGFVVRRLPMHGVDNLWAAGGGETRLLFAGHTDVVPPGVREQWHSDPFVMTEKDGYLYGRGAADMKSGVAAMITAACHAAREGGGDGVGVFLTSDEEGDAEHGTKYFVEWWKQNNGGVIPYAVVGEPTCEKHFGDAIKIGRRGSLTAQVCVRGRQTHAAYAHLGDNPAHRLLAALNQMNARWRGNVAAQAAGEMVTTFQVVELKSGVGADNVTPPHAEAVFNFRHIAADAAADLRRDSETILEEHAPGGWTCDWKRGAEPFLMPADGELVRVLRDGVRRQTGVQPALSTSGGTSDGRFLRHICRELVEFGVCNATIHAPNECVLAADVRALTAIYRELIRGLLSGD